MKNTILTWVILGWAFGACAQEIPGTKTTVSLNNALLSDALRQISEQTGNPTREKTKEPGEMAPKGTLENAPAKRVTLEAKDKPYWNVILDLCEKNNLTFSVERTIGVPELRLYQGEAIRPPTFINGAFMAQISRSEINSRVNFRSNPSRAIILSMDIWIEPVAGILKIATEPNIEQAAAAGGVSLAPAATNKDPRFTDMQNVSHSYTLELKHQPGVKSIKTLSGKIWVVREMKSEDWIIETDKAVGATRTICELDTMKITGLKRANDQIELDMEISTETNRESLMSHGQTSARIRYEGFENQQGVEVVTHVSGGSMKRVGKNTIETCKFKTSLGKGIAQMPGKLIIRVPAEVKAFEIPFEFHDLELP